MRALIAAAPNTLARLPNRIPLNYLSRWLGHASIQTTLIYLELVPDPAGSLASVP